MGSADDNKRKTPSARAIRRLLPLAPHQKMRGVGLGLDLGKQGIARLPGKRLEVAHRMQVGRYNLKHLAAFELGQCLFRPQNR